MRSNPGNQNTTLIDTMASPQIIHDPIPYETPDTLPEFDHNGLINVTLKPHQIVNINRAEKLERYEEIKIQDSSYSVKTRVGVFCDKVGAGKTLTVLGLIGKNPIVNCPSVFHFKSTINAGWSDCSGHRHNLISSRLIGETTYEERCESLTIPLNIIVVPHTIFSQWENSIKTYTTIPHFAIKNRKTNDKFWEDYKLSDLREGKCQIVLVTNKFYRIFSEHGFGNNVSVSRVIFDEVDTLSIPRNGKIVSNFYWGVTASYSNVINMYNNSGNYFPNAGFIRDLFISFRSLWQSGQSGITQNERRLVRSELFIRNSDEFIESSFHLPEIQFNIHPCDAPVMISVLNGVVSAEVMNLLNAGDVNAAIESVSCVKVDTKVSLIDVVTSEFQKELHNANIAYKAALEFHYSSESAKKKSLERHEEEIAKLESKITDLRSRVEDSDMCPVCCDEIENCTITRCCNNSFCFECITKSISLLKTCPVCRATMRQDDLIVVTDTAGGEKEPEQKKIEKRDAFQHIIDANKKWSEETGHACKYLVYSDSYYSLDNGYSVLYENGIRSAVIKGSIGAVTNTINKYRENTNELQALMVNSRYAASGMNLENTTDVVIWHSMERNKIAQIIGRAQRPGRKLPLRVHFLSYPNELKDFKDYK